MINLNELKKIALENAEKRHSNGANIDTNTIKMLKHTATEVVEATEAKVVLEACIHEFEYGDSEKIDDLNESIKKAMRDFESELADIICCVLIIAEKENIDIERAIYDCIEKNERRANNIGDKK